MQTFAQYALPGTILVAGLGAVVLCVMLLFYGFKNDPEDEGPSPALRLLVIRLGHALAATCFAAVVILSTAALIEQRRVAASPPPPPAAQAMPEVERLQAQVRTLASRLAAAELRLDDVAQARRPVASVTAPAVRPVTAPPASRPRKATIPHPSDGVSASPPTRPAPPPPPATAASPSQAPAPTPAAASVAAPPSDDLDVRMRDDWEIVKRGFRDAGEEIRSGMTGFARRVKGLFTRDGG